MYVAHFTCIKTFVLLNFFKKLDCCNAEYFLSLLEVIVFLRRLSLPEQFVVRMKLSRKSQFALSHLNLLINPIPMSV